MKQPLLTVKQTAATMQVSERSVRRWIADGRIEIVRVGRCIRISERAIVEFARSNTSGMPCHLNSL
jgi:excisionase family DNA binding protein